MSLKKLSNEQLDQRLKSLVQEERELLSDILQHIAEVDRRKLFLKMAYPNLFEYLTKHLGYSAGSAQRRIDAARLMNDVPDLSEKLESGELSLAQVSLVQKSIRHKMSSTKSYKPSKEVKQFLIEEISGLSFEASQKTVAQVLDLEIKEAPKVQIQKDDSVRLEVTLSKEQWEKLQAMRELLSTSLPRGSWDEVLEYLADKVINQKTKLKNPPKASENLTEAKKKFIRKEDECCQLKDSTTNKICGSKWNLQIDHIRPQWAGGSNDLENLQVLCGNHNRYRYKRRMDSFEEIGADDNGTDSIEQ